MVGVSNQTPDVYFNVSHIGAQLHSPYDYSYFIQNFTVRELEAVVGPGQETTVEYRFHPDPSLEPIDFRSQLGFITTEPRLRVSIDDLQ